MFYDRVGYYYVSVVGVRVVSIIMDCALHSSGLDDDSASESKTRSWLLFVCVLDCGR